MEEIEWWEFDSAAELADQAAGDIGFVIESAVEASGSACLALPGGKTPLPVYEALVRAPGIDWSKVTILPTDDRIVPLGDPLSNFAMLEGLFAPKGATVISLIDEAALDDVQEAGRLADERLKLLKWPLDLVCLGVGTDGHTASIFPGPDFDRALNGPRERRAIGVRPEPKPAEAPVDRVSLTGAAIASARALMIVITGAEKRRVVEQAVKEGPLSSMPIGRLLGEIDNSVDILWTA